MTRGSEGEVVKRGRVWFYTGLMGLGLSIAASVVLTLEQLAGLQLPGCGPGSACSNLAAGPGGSIAGWPVSYLGLAWFVGLAVAWIGSRRGVSGNLRGAVRLGLVVFGGYQCPGCRRAEEELEVVLTDHGEQIRFTFRHFPMCRDCNWTILHPSHDNACQAAWAAEAAAMLGGNEGFWRMHHGFAGAGFRKRGFLFCGHGER